MARERIITLRHLSQEANGLLPPQALAMQADNTRRQSRFQPSGGEPDATDGQDVERLLSPTTHARRASRTPVLVVDDYSPGSAHDHQQPGEGEKKRSMYRGSSSSAKSQQEEEDDRRTLEGDYDPLIKHFFGDGPIVASGRFDTPPEKASLPHPAEALDMGQFMNKVSQLSTRIDAIEIELLENKPSFSNDAAFRAALYDRIGQEVVQDLVGLRNTYRPKSPQSSEDYDRQSIEKRRRTLSTPEIEDSLKVEQIHGLTSRAKSLVTGLIARLTDEKQIIANQIEYEWTKELSGGGSKSSRHSAVTLADNNSIDSSNYQLFSKLTQIDADPRSSRFYSDELEKILNLAVRSSTSYPEARKSSLFIKSKVDLSLQMQDELQELNEYLRCLSCSRARYASDESASGDDSSSVSFSLDGIDEADDKGPAQGDRKGNKIRFKIGDRPSKSKKTENIADLESNSASCHRLSYGPHLSYAIQDNRSCFSRYKFAILCAGLACVLLICMGMLIYFNLKAHNE
ncbi:hypothetical protein PTTG_05778 [Puccinia triticina 1-1 BBBD Race 1]|uniref:Uncharacterized protein n=1 Tax=Puccinia triticina (isolate 1-1 / race 1 (BBBD)) TaxID=630390 RepID=A0A180GXV6_PUCT1|nr:hypothetical protein PTTG_05778 [Puccinia triticina 1-1 BBBD Race 1]